MATARSVAAVAFVCLCVAVSSAASPAKAVVKVVRRSPSPVRRSPVRRPASPKPAGKSVSMCFWEGRTCYLDPSYFLSTKAPAPISPYTAKILSNVAKDYVCYARTTKAKCNAAISDGCLWAAAGYCSFAVQDDAACPTSRVMAFLKCDYFNLAGAKAPSCTSSKPCAYDKARGCHHPSFSKWAAAALKSYRRQISDGTLELSNYGCCSSFLTYAYIYPDLCDSLTTKKECVAGADCVWSPSAGCGLTDAAAYRYQLEALTTANIPFGTSYKNADAECGAYKTAAACGKKRVPVDAAKLAKYRRPYKEAALDAKKYCSTTILGP